MARKNTATSWALLIVPLVVTILLSRLIRPLQLLFQENWYTEWIIYAAALLLGYFLFRRARTVRDYEWRRQKAMQSVKGHIRAEERGVWERDVIVPTGLGEEGQAALSGVAGSLSNERQTEEVEESNVESDVNLLVESEHVVKATRRVTGDETYNYEEVESTSGTVRKSSPMDRLIDWFSGKIANRKMSAPPEQEKPLTLESKNYEVSTPEENVVDTTPAEPVNIDPESAAIYGTGSDSMESLAALSVPNSVQDYDPTGKGAASSGYAINRCNECGMSNPVESRYCEQCGTTL